MRLGAAALCRERQAEGCLSAHCNSAEANGKGLLWWVLGAAGTKASAEAILESFLIPLFDYHLLKSGLTISVAGASAGAGTVLPLFETHFLISYSSLSASR